MQFTKTLITLAAAFAGTTFANSGEATYFYGDVAAGACGYTKYKLPSNIFGVSINSGDFSSGADCGKCISVNGPKGGPITAMVVDLCVGCGTDGLDLFSDAFAAIGNPAAGVIDVTWEYVKCPTTDLPTGGNYN